MQSFRKILLGVDLSRGDRLVSDELTAATEEATHRAFWLGAQLATAELTILSVLDVSPQAEDALKGGAAAPPSALSQAEALLDGLVERARREGVKSVRRQVAFGRPWEQIFAEVQRGGHDLVIIGTGRSGPRSKLLFGSTGLKLLRYCPSPVWVTKPDPDWDDLNILVASDLSETSQDALTAGVQAGQLSGAKLHVLHAYAPEFDVSDAGVREREGERRREAEHRLHMQLARTDYRTLPHGVMVHVFDGPADEAILRAIDEFGIDLLIIGTAARHGVSGLLLGNTAERLLPQVPCSVLVIKPHGFGRTSSGG